MEKEKTRSKIEETVLPFEGEESVSFEQIGLEKTDSSSTPSEKQNTEEFKKTRRSPRMAVSLASNISGYTVSRNELEEMFNTSQDKIFFQSEDGNPPTEATFENLQIPEALVDEGIQDLKYKPVRFKGQEIKIICAIQCALTEREESPQLKLFIEQTESGSKDPFFLPFDINGKEISKRVNNGRSNVEYKNRIREMLHSISLKVQVFSFQEKQHGKNNKYTASFPIIIHKATIDNNFVDKDGKPRKEFFGMKVELFRPFFDNIRTKNTPINPELLFPLWIDSDLYANLFMKINELWFYSYVGYHKAKREVFQKYGNMKNGDKIPEIEEELHKEQYKALTKTLNFETIWNLTEADYSSTKQKRFRFKKELRKCIDHLIRYGIITSRSHVDEVNERAVFVMNIHFDGKTPGNKIESKRDEVRSLPDTMDGHETTE